MKLFPKMLILFLFPGVLPTLLASIELSVHRLRKIIDDLLEKHEEKKKEKVVFSLHQVLDELIGEYEGQRTSHLKFHKSYSSEAIDLYGDPNRLQRAFGNIIKNAIEAMEGKGGIRIATVVENGSAIVSIADTGPGMTEELLQKVLRGGITQGKKDGHGIGMTVVREAVEDHGGQLQATSIPGSGTTFFIRLLLPSPDILQNAPREKMAMAKFVVTAAANGPIIVIDDDPVILEQWRLILQQKKCPALLFSCYEDFEKAGVEKGVAETAVVDYHFDNSEKNGLDVVSLLQSKGFSHLYLCTAEYWKPQVQKRAKELRTEICPKPIPPVEIART